MEINSSSSSNRGGGMMAMINDQSNDHHHHQQQQIELPPGFRFHPTDEELITHYLSPKIIDAQFNPVAIGEVDLNKVEPWDLPRKAKMGEKEWYFFCVKDRKYPTGLRTNRATEAGYWKATGKDKEIFRGKALVGMKKTLVFYTGRAPKGNKTNWVMHEYRLEGGRSASSSNYNTTLLKSSKDDWVICRVFNKGSNLKKVPGPGSILAGRMMMIDTDTDTDSQYDGGGGGGGSDLHDEHHHPYLPPLMDSSPVSGPFNQNASSSGSVRQYYTPPQHVTCFSTTAAAREEVGNDMNLLKSLPKQSDGFQFNNVANRDYYNTAATAAAPAAVSCSSSSMLPDSTSSFGMNQGAGQLSGQDPVYFQDQSSVLRMLLDGNNYGSDYYGFGAAVGCAGGANHTTTAMSGGGGTYTDMSSGGNNVVPCSEMVRRNQSSYQPLLQQGNNQMNPNRLDSSSSVDLDCLLNF